MMEIPQEMKAAVRTALRERLGDKAYDEMKFAMGEDALVEQFILASSNAPAREEVPESWLSRYGGWIMLLLVLGAGLGLWRLAGYLVSVNDGGTALSMFGRGCGVSISTSVFVCFIMMQATEMFELFVACIFLIPAAVVGGVVTAFIAGMVSGVPQESIDAATAIASLVVFGLGVLGVYLRNRFG